MFNVDGGHRAVKFNVITGMKAQIYDEGTHFLLPFIEKPIMFNIRTSASQVTSATGSRDLQTVNITVRVLTRPDPQHLVSIYRQLGLDYADRVLPSICNEVLKAVIAKFNASELLTRRADVSNMIRQQLMTRALDFGLLIDDVAITQLGFSKEYRDAVEAKQIAEQEAGRAKFRVDQAIQEKKSVEVLAEGEAEAARLIGEALRSNPGFIQLRRFEAAKHISQVLAKSKNKVYLNAEALLLNVDDQATKKAH